MTLSYSKHANVILCLFIGILFIFTPLGAIAAQDTVETDSPSIVFYIKNTISKLVYFLNAPFLANKGEAIENSAVVSLANILGSNVPDSVDVLPITIIGELVVNHIDDFDNRTSRDIYLIRDLVHNEILELKFKNKENIPPGLISGAVLKVHGKRSGESFEVTPLDPNTDSSGVEVISTTEPVAAAQNKRVLVMLGNFSNKNLGCNNGQVDNTMFSDPNNRSVDDYFIATSHGQLGMTGDTIGPFTIGYTSASSDYYGWASALESQAGQAGYNLSDYDNYMYVLPPNGLTAGGLGSLGGPRTWIFYCNYPSLFAHELGHNLQMHHASQGTSEYGDTSDTMGYYAYFQVNAPHVDQEGWLPTSKIISVNGVGTYTLSPLHQDPNTTNNPQILKIPKPDTNEFYYVSYRTSDGFDTGLGSTYNNRINIHRYRGSGAIKTFFLSSLIDGSSFSDTNNGITITQVSHSPLEATVDVSLICTPNNPTVTITPFSQVGTPADTVAYSVTITNRDSALCGESTFALNVLQPVGWTYGLGSSAVTLSPGQLIAIPMSLTSTLDAPDGSYSVTVNAIDQRNISLIGSDASLYIIDTTPPSTPENVLVAEKRKQNNLTWDPSSDNVEIRSYRVYRNGAQIGETSSTSFNDRFRTKESVVYQVQSVDSAGNTSDLSENATVSTGDGGGTSSGSGKPTKCSPWPQCNK